MFTPFPVSGQIHAKVCLEPTNFRARSIFLTSTEKKLVVLGRDGFVMFSMVLGQRN
jgi:hypothetical protein